MLLNVNVKNLALIKHVDICFEEGLNILTGETGTGKSIIIGSILIALGGKIPKDIIRDEDKEALVELVFYVKDCETIEKLESLGVNPEEGKVIISRKIVNRRSMTRVNGENFTASNLKKVTELLIDIHGQHDHQSLLKTSKHLEILDKYAESKIIPIKDKLQQEYRNYTNLNKELKEICIDEETRKREISFCTYEIEEIENANLVEGEYEEKELLFKKMSNSKNTVEALSEISNILGYDNLDGVGEKISNSEKLLQGINIKDQELESMSSMLLDMESLCQDLVRNINSYVENLSFDEATTIELEQRVDLLNKLRQKYVSSKIVSDVTKEILNYKSEQEEKLEQLNNTESIKLEIEKKIEKSTEQLEELSSQLTKIRKENAVLFEKDLIKVLKGLNFLDIRFEVEFKKEEFYTANGRDLVQFLISTNPGEPLRPLISVASGGELSRIMLGIKTIMASKDSIDTLIFDEIDTGISGKTAQLVAERMKSVSKLHQIICITHLPQIAAMADEHFLINKNVNDKTTETQIKKLTEKESVEELCRMLSGKQITKAAIDNAKEMKEAAKKIK